MGRHLQKIENGWRYYRSIPRAFRDVVGGTAWSKYLGKSHSERDAERYARDADVIHDATIARLKKLSPEDLKHIVAKGGLRRVKGAESDLEALATFTGELSPDEAHALQWFLDASERDLQASDPRAPLSAGAQALVARSRARSSFSATTPPLTEAERQGRRALALLDAKEGLKALRQEIAERSALAGGLELRDDRGLGSLLKLAPKYKPQSPKSMKRARLYMTRFVEHLGGDKDPRSVTQEDVAGWRDALADDGHSNQNQSQHLSKIGALFKHAVNDRLIPVNPFAGITALPDKVPRKKSDRKRRFEPRELREFVKGAGLQPGTFALVADCLIYSGMRSSEVCNLLVRDVRRVDGILVFDLHDEVRPLKNTEAPRLVPVANKLVKRLTALTKGRDGDEWLFDDLPHTQVDGAEHRWQTLASAIIREFMPRLHRGKDDPRLTAYCTRHTFIQTCEDAGVAERVCYAIVGHQSGNGDVHSTAYRGRPPLKDLKAGVEKTAAAIGKML